MNPPVSPADSESPLTWLVRVPLDVLEGGGGTFRFNLISIGFQILTPEVDIHIYIYWERESICVKERDGE